MIIEEIENISPLSAFLSVRAWASPFIFTWEERFAYLSADPILTIGTEGGRTTLNAPGREAREFSDPFAAASFVLAKYGGPPVQEAGPFPFSSGLAGYFAYGLKDVIEPSRARPPKKRHGIDVPGCVLGLYDPVYVYDHEVKKGWLASRSGDKQRFERFREQITGEKAPEAPYAPPPSKGFTSNITKEEYLRTIAQAKEYISAGDIYQINISQRLDIPWVGDPFTLYANLLKARPARYSAFMDYGGFQVIANSPERLLKVKDGVAETRPIKGTRPRGTDEAHDRALIEELKKSPKERAEHVMIVDLERNDLGRVSVPGTVEVAAFSTIESYPTLHHMVSTVRGRLKPGIDSPSALREVFPGGSITGAPKIRAMEIIDELEADERGIYTGGIGWMDLCGWMDISMAIRTAVCRDGHLYLHVGGGIVADSVAEAEYEETLLKARDFLDVMGLCAGG